MQGSYIFTFLYVMSNFALFLHKYFNRFCGYPPFRSNDEDSLYDMIKKGDIDFSDELWEEVSDEGLLA